MDSDLDWAELDRNRKERESKLKRELWNALERDGVVPERAILEQLSGLLGDDIERVRGFWHELDLEMRRELIHTLSEIAEADFTMDFTAVFRIALADADPEIRATAVAGLRELEDVRLVPIFTQMLAEDPAAKVRRAVAEGLAKYVLLGELGKIRPTPFNDAVTALIAAHTKQTEDLEVQRRAMESVAYTGTHEVPELIAAAYRCDTEALRISAVFAMGRSADERWGEVVQFELQNPNPEMRFEATRACGELQLRAAVRELVDLAEDADTTIRVMALWSLGQIGGDVARRTLQAYTASDEEIIREAAEEALQELEFFHGDLETFFGPPEAFDGESEMAWDLASLYGDEDEASSDDDDEDDGDDDDEDERLDDEAFYEDDGDLYAEDDDVLEIEDDDEDWI